MIDAINIKWYIGIVMTYNSPKEIRRRQQAAENKVSRPRRARAITMPTNEQWEKALDAAISRLQERANQGNNESAGRCAQAIVRAAIYRRALEITLDSGCADAMNLARIELLGKEPE